MSKAQDIVAPAADKHTTSCGSSQRSVMGHAAPKRIKVSTRILLNPNLPTWARRLLSSGETYIPTFKEEYDFYVFARSTRNLYEASPLPLETIAVTIDMLKTILSKEAKPSNLDKIKFTLTQIKKGVGPDVSYQKRKERLGIQPPRDDYLPEERADLARGIKFMAQGAKNARQQAWRYRLETALTENIAKGWYPLFGTYTIDSTALPEGVATKDDLWKNTRAWDTFVRKFKTEVADSLGYGRKPNNWPKPVSDWFQYFAVLEHGSSASQNHPHVHCVFMCRNIPKLWKLDPNRHNRLRDNTDIRPASALWPYGFISETKGIFCSGSFFFDNWYPPIVDGQPQKVGSCGAIAAYISKYLTKGEKKWHHRVKATRGLRLARLRREVRKIQSLSLLATMAMRPAEYKVKLRLELASNMPLSLLRNITTNELMNRLYSSNSRSATKLMLKHWTRPKETFYSSFRGNVLNGQRPWKKSILRLYNWLTRMLAAPPSTVHSSPRGMQRVASIESWLKANFPKPAVVPSYTLLKAKMS